MTDAATAVHLPLLSSYLKEQSQLSAVERFSTLHDQGALDASAPPAQSKYYRDLLPTGSPGKGQQYAFEVDLDRCSGCKACVAACHSLNGLDEEETWRAVGLLHGGSPEAPVQQTVTTACHHCADPACMKGCPVNAYEKDPITGIVKHLDDQCIGCQYCTLTCPYEVPQYNKQRGIVRKCDMCSDRLGEGEAPACVQACPTEAISIQVVSQREVIENAQVGALVPGAPASSITAPSTRYTSKRALPKNTLPADFYVPKRGQQHMPLVTMLVLTQLSVGAFLVELLKNQFLSQTPTVTSTPYHALVAALLGLLAIGASTAHLGRPHLAYRAVLGIKSSWLSREILAFGLFAGAAIFYAGSLWQEGLLSMIGLNPLSPGLAAEVQSILRMAVSATGIAGVLCSVMLYRVTQRAYWAGSFALFKFCMTAAVLGLATTLVTSTGADLLFGGAGLTRESAVVVKALAVALTIATATKLLYEASIFLRLHDKDLSDLKRTALLLKGELRKEHFWRFVTGALGGVFIPTFILALGQAKDSVNAFVAALLCLGLCTAGEFLERRLFFSAASSATMPGSGIS